MRRLLGWASVTSSADKVNTVLRLLAGLGALGIREAWLMPDAAGMAARVRESAALAQGARDQPLPTVRLLDMPVHDGASDSTRAARLMAARGVAAIAVLGGDGTHRAVAQGCGEVPLATLSTGTNNAFPGRHDATLVGLATALVATARVPAHIGVRANKCLHVHFGSQRETALVDVCVSRQRALAGRAVWDGRDLLELFTTFAEPHSLGLSSVAGLLLPTARSADAGVHVRMGVGRTLLAPILPGALVRVDVASALPFPAGVARQVGAREGTMALDGERLIEFDAATTVQVELALDGPGTIAIEEVLAEAALRGLLLA
jgi:predicted polyphosphate/ATP-dependent NAD kinase